MTSIREKLESKTRIPFGVNLQYSPSVNRGATTAEVVKRLTQSAYRVDGQVRLRADAAAAVSTRR